MEEVIQVALDEIQPNPWQVERLEGPQTLQELAESILAYGMIETPMGRIKNENEVQLATGHRRLAAHRLLISQGYTEFAKMRVRTTELGDEHMADIVIQENKKRQDIDPIAEAKFYQRYLKEFKVTQTELAKRVGITQGELSHHIRLLELPETVQQLIMSRDITARHGRALLKLQPWPRLTGEFLKENPTHQLKTVSVNRLEEAIDEFLAGKGESLQRADFDAKQVCAKCPNRTVAKSRWSSERYPVCLDLSCYKEKQAAAAERLRQERERKAQERLTESKPGERIEKDVLPYGTYREVEKASYYGG